MDNMRDTWYMAWVIGSKDILEAIKNKATSINLVLMLFIVGFFYWLNMLRPFDRGVSVAVYDAGSASLALEHTTLSDGADYEFRIVDALEKLPQAMTYQDLGLALPADLDQTLASGGVPQLTGYIFWSDRKKAAALEDMFTRAFSEIAGKPVQVVIGQNIIIPDAMDSGMQTQVAQQLVYFIFWTALMLVPHLMLEEKQTRTLEALLTSPASPGQVVLGKAFAGLFYIVIVGGLAVGIYWTYVVNWGLALLAFLGFALLAVGLALLVGSFLKSPQQLGVWMVGLILLLVIPATFYMEPFLKESIRAVLTWFPSAALATLYRCACSTGVTPTLFWPNFAVVAISITLTFALLVWIVRRSDR